LSNLFIIVFERFLNFEYIDMIYNKEELANLNFSNQTQNAAENANNQSIYKLLNLNIF